VLAENIKQLEKEYFSERREMVVPDLLCSYFDDGAYELVYYLSWEYMGQYGQAEFYLMMSLMEMGYREDAGKIFYKNREEWYNLCKQNEIYWKHVALYALFFCDFHVSAYYSALFDQHYDDCLVQLLELAQEAVRQEVETQAIVKTELFARVLDRYPALETVWGGFRKQKSLSDEASGWEESSRQVITFEKIQWNIWRKYNAGIGNGKKYGMEKVYENGAFQIYSYKPKEVAASMHVLTDGESTILLDCGCEISGTEVIRIPVKEILAYLGIAQVEAIFISHAHMDHYGSLNELRGQKLVMTSMTRQLIRYAAPEVALDGVCTVEGYGSYETGGILVRFLPNGHIRGSVAMDIDWKGKYRIVYTGDYTVENQRTVEGFRIGDILCQDSRKIDVLLTETTYGKKRHMLKLGEYEKMFVELCRKQFENENKIIIPCFAIGRVQEVALLLTDMARETGAKILIDGLAARITEYYQLSMGQNILNRNISICRSEFDYAEKIKNNDIILASSGMMKEGSTSAGYIEELMEEDSVCVMKVGFIHENEHMLLSVMNRRHKNINYVDIPLSAHAGYHSLVETTEKLSPDCVVYVHGGGIER